VSHREVYSAALTREQFLFYEIRAVARLSLEGLDDKAIHARVLAENLFQFPTERSVRDMTNTCLRRIHLLENDTLVGLLGNAPADVGKQVNLYAMMCDNRIVWDFMMSVVGEKFRIHDLSFGRTDVNMFLFRLQEQNDVAANWSDGTVSKLKSVLSRCLLETGYLSDGKDEVLNPVLLYDEVEKGIRANGDLAALSAFNCFR